MNRNFERVSIDSSIPLQTALFCKVRGGGGLVGLQKCPISVTGAGSFNILSIVHC